VGHDSYCDTKNSASIFPRLNAMKVIPLGDCGSLAYLDDETAAFAFAAMARATKAEWLVDVVQAYTSVAVFFDLERIYFKAVDAWMHNLTTRASQSTEPISGRIHNIPCCYEMQQDLVRVAAHTGLTEEDVIRLHLSADYTVYAIGFCPGFPYLGYLPGPLQGVPRLDTPRLTVEAGSVGLTGRQTGIYTEARPGGWNLIGRTPLALVNVAEGYFPLRTGDRIRFERIDLTEYRKLEGTRLVD
jgi:inhibitor of KinA